MIQWSSDCLPGPLVPRFWRWGWSLLQPESKRFLWQKELRTWDSGLTLSGRDIRDWEIEYFLSGRNVRGWVWRLRVGEQIWTRWQHFVQRAYESYWTNKTLRLGKIWRLQGVCWTKARRRWRGTRRSWTPGWPPSATPGRATGGARSTWGSEDSSSSHNCQKYSPYRFWKGVLFQICTFWINAGPNIPYPYDLLRGAAEQRLSQRAWWHRSCGEKCCFWGKKGKLIFMSRLALVGWLILLSWSAVSLGFL